MRLCQVCRGPEASASSENARGSCKRPMALTGQNFDNFWPDGRGKKSRTQVAAKLDPAEFPDARNQLELLDRLFPRKTTGDAPNQRRSLRRIVPRVGARPNPAMMVGSSKPDAHVERKSHDLSRHFVHC